MKTAAFLGFSTLMAGLVAAAPLEKRAYATHTVTEEVVETVDVTVTITVEAVTTTQAAEAAHANANDYSWSWNHQQQAEPTQSAEVEQPDTYEPPSQQAQEPAPAPTTSEPAYVAPTEAPAPTTTAAPVQETPKQEEPKPEEPKQEEPVPEQPNTYEPPAEEPKPSQGGGESHTGEITFYDAALGSCGWTNDGNSENVVALSHELMGPVSNGNSYCGRMIEVTRGGKTTRAKVVDKCMGCPYNNVDLSRKAFGEIADYDEGRVPGCSWRFVD